jgi:hypothetical protein
MNPLHVTIEQATNVFNCLPNRGLQETGKLFYKSMLSKVCLVQIFFK